MTQATITELEGKTREDLLDLAKEMGAVRHQRR